ncbi:MAG: PilZ domain-containing protein [Myxococcota bacterium]|nr:PilZ domain-containing protein [Myxococcota bacterium]
MPKKPVEPSEEDSELRSSDRVTINKEFESFDAFIQEYVTNISRSGVFVKSKQPLPIGTRVNLKFTVIMDDIETIEGVGEVVRVQSDPSGMGVVFRELSQYSQHLIERLLTSPSAAIVGGDAPGGGADA